MGFLAKADALFVGLRLSNSYHQALQVPPDKEAFLKTARREIRSAIRTAATAIQLVDAYWEGDYSRLPSRNRPVVEPRFFTQGSVAYNLLIDPCQSPPQQLDLDDGMYVRVDFLDGRPALVAQALFQMVEQALAPLCRARGWVLNRSKQTCVRVEISSDSHIDIPIYSAPRGLEGQLAFASDALQKSMITKRAGQEYTRLPSDQIMLAHRDGTWQQSDPLKLHEWVENCVTRYGEDFRRLCRYLKGWRDHTWKGCCLSSITIMAAVAEALKEIGGAHRSMPDDQLVHEVSQRLPNIFRGSLHNPALPGQFVVLNDWSDEQRQEIVSSSETLARAMRDALSGTGVAQLVVDKLRSAFGHRIPNRPDMVEIARPATAAVVSERPATVALPQVTKSTSG